MIIKKVEFCIIVVFLILFSYISFSAEIKWARGKFECVESDCEDKWDCHIEWDEYFLEEVNRLTTIKINPKVDKVPLDDLNKMCNYSFIFLHASGTPAFTKTEKANIKEYLLRGGFIFAEDCIDYFVDNKFFRGFKKIVEEEIFPGKKFEVLPNSHPIYHCHFDLPKGLVCNQLPVAPGMGLSDDKGRLMIFLSSADINCEWSTRNFDKAPAAYKMGINIITYALTH